MGLVVGYQTGGGIYAGLGTLSINAAGEPAFAGFVTGGSVSAGVFKAALFVGVLMLRAFAIVRGRSAVRI